MHPVQKKALELIKKNHNITVRDLMARTGAGSSSVMDYHLNKLMAKGYIKRADKWVVL